MDKDLPSLFLRIMLILSSPDIFLSYTRNLEKALYKTIF